jgi:hypothetical protein
METKTLKTIEDFLEFINDSWLNIETNYYRGHADYSWDVIPGIARNKGIKDIQSLLEIERKLIDNFQKKINENKLEDLVPKISGSYHESWILLMAAQHYGLPTRLIDFSHDKFVALEFAVADIQHLNKDGALIIYNDVNAIHENVDSSILKSQFKNTHKSFFLQAPSYKFHENNNCKLSEMRKTIQGSKFLYRDSPNLLTCLTLEEKHNDYLKVVHIPKEMKIEIIKYLIKIEKMAYDLFAGRNELDFYAAILKLQFSKLNDTNIAEFLKS